MLDYIDLIMSYTPEEFEVFLIRFFGAPCVPVICVLAWLTMIIFSLCDRSTIFRFRFDRRFRDIFDALKAKILEMGKE